MRDEQILFGNEPSSPIFQRNQKEIERLQREIFKLTEQYEKAGKAAEDFGDAIVLEDRRTRRSDFSDLGGRGVLGPIRGLPGLDGIGRPVRPNLPPLGSGVLADLRGLPGLQGIGEDAAEEISDTQRGILESTQATMSAFVGEIGSALTTAEFRFDRFVDSVVSSIGQIIARQLVLRTIVEPLLGVLDIPIDGFAKGAAIAGGRVQAFAKGGVVRRPTIFPMASGDFGLMSEFESEAIMPLARTPKGELGVRAVGGGGGSFAPSIVVNVNAPTDSKQIPQETANAVRRAVEEAWRTQALRESRPGGLLRPLA